MKHNHRIVPGHMGGEYVEGNVISVEVIACDKQTANHVMWHFATWQLWGRKEDEIAWKGLAGYYNKEEMIKEIMRVNGKRAGLRNLGRKLSDEHRETLRQSHLGKTHTTETKTKMSQTRRGKPQPHKRKPRSVDTREKISDSLTGRKKSASHCQKLSEANMGVHVGKKWWVNKDNDVKFCHESPGEGWQKGRKWKG